MNCRFGFLLLFLVFFLPGAFAQQGLMVDKVVCQIGDRIILHSDIEDQYSYMKSQNAALPEDAKCYIIDQLLTQELLMVQADIDSVVVSEDEVNQRLDGRFDQILRYMNNDPEQFKSYYGKTVEQMREEQRESLQNQMVAQRMQGQIMADISITPSEVISFFNEIPVDSLPYFNSEVEVCEIVMFPKANEEEDLIALNKLKDIRKRIIYDNEDFETLAKEYSEDPGSGANGGNLGAMRRGELVPEFEAAAYNLQADEVSEIVKTDFGYHIIMLNERRGNIIDTKHILIKPKITQADLDKTAANLDSIRQLIVIDTLKFNAGVFLFSDENVQSKHNAGCLVNPTTGDSYFETADLSPEVYFAIDSMEVGQISAPFQYQTPAGEIGFRIILLRSSSEPHQANLQEDYSKIKNAALEAKKSLYINDWVIEKSKSSYIRIDSSFSNCEILSKWNKAAGNQ